MIEGQIRSALDSHPDWPIPESCLCSFTKRVYGTVTSPEFKKLLEEAFPEQERVQKVEGVSSLQRRSLSRSRRYYNRRKRDRKKDLAIDLS